MSPRLIITYLALVAFLGLVALTYINRSTNTNYVALEGKEFEKRVKTVISENPELILETVMNFQQREAEVEKEKAQNNVKELYKKIIADKSLTRIGKGKIKVIEFYDYGCGYCKTMANIKQEYSDKGVEFIVIDTPVLGENSITLARAAIAMQMIAPKKAKDIHFAFLEDRESRPKILIQKLLDQYEIDPAKFKEIMKSSKVTAKIQKGRDYATDAGLYATPAYIINGKLYMGAFPKGKFKEFLNNTANN